jgi:hypothetical protein
MIFISMLLMMMRIVVVLSNRSLFRAFIDIRPHQIINADNQDAKL